MFIKMLIVCKVKAQTYCTLGVGKMGVAYATIRRVSEFLQLAINTYDTYLT